ncbi:helix-turn-helix domain-containing protein [Flagellimonas meridianipacifica]|uniref:AraC-like DNA-binding protein n=1 Tax=Flagellimonas meridianipacifica TaxID=1080225 RepID=A0A2T0M812_9FLAO|nr:helix-turn-helix domain-containing protein [Allomuricauda pacifica]PRX53608.1 AraC-like DNA-binding protein [Allomuricauda pacifica]
MNGNEGNNPSFISKLRQIVLDNLREEQFSVEDLATEYGLSRSQLHKKLKKSIGKSVSQFIREVRLDEGLKLLRETDLTVSEVAYEVGFASPTYFNTCFKNYMGYSPGEVKIRNNIDDLEDIVQVGSSNVKQPQKRKWVFYSIGAIISIALFYGVIQIGKNVGRSQEAEMGVALEGRDGSEKKSIAVLPLKNWSGNENLDYISDGMTDAIINKLAKIESIDKVIPYTSVARYKVIDKSIKEIAQELGVNNVIQGSFQLAGNSVSIKLQMIDGESEQQFWDQEYNETWVSDELFKLQAMVAENISETIGVEITETEENEIASILTSNKQAYDLYLQANYEWSKGTKLGYDNAKRLYNKAVQIDSTFVEAYVNLSLVWHFGSSYWGYYSRDGREIAKKYLLKAGQVAPNNKKVIDARLRMALFNEWDFAMLEEDYHKTLIAPLYLLYTGKYEEALVYMKNADDLKKADENLYIYWYAETLFYNNRMEEALDLYKDYYAIYNDDFEWVRNAVKYLYHMGEYQIARKWLDNLMRISPDRPPIIIWLHAVINESLGQDEGVNEILELLKDFERKNKPGSPAWFTALYYCHIKEYDTAFYWLNKSYDNHENEMVWLHSEPLLRPIREDARYLELHKKVGFPVAPLGKQPAF